MKLEAQINFYLSERNPNKPKGYHYQFISWKRIVNLYHPRKFQAYTELRQLAAALCRYAIEHAASKSLDQTEMLELKAAYKTIDNAEADKREKA